MILSEAVGRANTVIETFLELTSDVQCIPTLRQIQELSTAVSTVGAAIPKGVLSSPEPRSPALVTYQRNLRRLVRLLELLNLRAVNYRRDLARQLSHFDKVNAWIRRAKLIATDSDE